MSLQINSENSYILPASAIEALRAHDESESPRVLADIEEEQRNKDRLFSIPAQLYQAPYIVICSVWPKSMVSQHFTHGGRGRKQYTIAAGSPEKPSYMLVQNTYDIIMLQGPENKPEYQAAPINASHLATNLIDYWTGNHPGNKRGKPGIGVILGEIKDGVLNATAQEIEVLVRQQKEFNAYLVETADNLWDSGKPENRVKIKGEHRRALQALGLDQDQHPWFKNRQIQHSRCPRCQEQIMSEATYCKHCHCDLANYFEEEGIAVNKEVWPNVSIVLERRARRKSPPDIDTKSKKGDK